MSSASRDYQLLDPSEEELEKSNYGQLRHLRKDAKVRAILFWSFLASVVLNILVCAKLYKALKYQDEHTDVTKYGKYIYQDIHFVPLTLIVKLAWYGIRQENLSTMAFSTARTQL